MPIDLPDVNVWFALSYEGHVHHSRARAYWDQERSHEIAFCCPTATGLLRLLTTPPAMQGHPLTPADAFQKYRGFTALSDVGYIGDSPGLDQRIEPWASESFFSRQLWTDAWIAALAIENGCRVVSFDSDFTRFPGLKFLHLKP